MSYVYLVDSETDWVYHKDRVPEIFKTAEEGYKYIHDNLPHYFEIHAKKLIIIETPDEELENKYKLAHPEYEVVLYGFERPYRSFRIKID